MAVEITRKDLASAQLRAAASRTKDARAARRMLAIALVLEGVDRATAAKSCGMDRQTLRDWVHRYNAEGLAGLANRRSPGRQPRLTPAQKAELAAWVEAGPDPKVDGVVRWRRKDLQRRIAARFGVEMHERQQGNVVGDRQGAGPVPAGAVEQHDGVGAGRDGAADLGQVQREGAGVGGGQHQRGGGGARRADGAEEVSPVEALVARCPRPAAALGPDAGEGPLLADPRLVLEPDLEWLAARRFRDRLGYRLAEVLWDGPPLRRRFA